MVSLTNCMVWNGLLFYFKWSPILLTLLETVYHPKVLNCLEWSPILMYYLELSSILFYVWNCLPFLTALFWNGLPSLLHCFGMLPFLSALFWNVTIPHCAVLEWSSILSAMFGKVSFLAAMFCNGFSSSLRCFIMLLILSLFVFALSVLLLAYFSA